MFGSSSHSELDLADSGLSGTPTEFPEPCGNEKPKKKNSILLDVDMKLAALKVSPSVVCLDYSRGVGDLPELSGTIIQCKDATDEDGGGGKYDVTVLTCAGFLSYYKVPNHLPEVDVHSADGSFRTGKVTAFDSHYNIAIVQFKSKKPRKIASLKSIDDFMPMNPKPDNPSAEQHFTHTEAQTNSVKLCVGDKVMALARRRTGHRLIARSGVFSVESSALDCQELYMTTCKGTSDHIGGPIINCHGEVIGISFYDKGYAPFLPINIAYRCLRGLQEFGRVQHPFLGMKLASFYVADLAIMEKITRKFPEVHQGVLVMKVMENSPAYDARIRPNDVITHCNSNPVSCSSEFFVKMWDEVGKRVDLAIVRESDRLSGNRTLHVVETDPKDYNRWPNVQETRSYVRISDLKKKSNLGSRRHVMYPS